MPPSDLNLLRAYACDGRETAFTQLVERHSGWVFAAARRRLRDDHLADDATQAVFMVLAGKASQLVASERGSISAWLFHVLHLTCGRIKRTRARQNRRESQAGMLRQAERPALADDELMMLLEDAIAQLPSADREAVVRRFYEGADFATIGKSLNVSAEAARKRVGRALRTVKEWLLEEGIDAIPDELLAATETPSRTHQRVTRAIEGNRRINLLAKGTMVMVQQIEAIDFAVMSAEFFVKDVEASLDFFEKLGFRRHFTDTPDAMGRLPRASMRGGKSARLWLRRATETEGTRPTPGVALFFWINGGAEALTAHRKAIAAQGVKVSAFSDDISLRNFTVTSPDGYRIGFFTAYK